jgi:hypothetical protein
MQIASAIERFEVDSAKSTLTFFVRTTTSSVSGKATGLAGSIDCAWSAAGIIAETPAPKMHVEFQVEGMRSGNDFKDKEMWKLIDSKRFPKIAADLLTIRPNSKAGTYTASGKITLAGLAKTYEGIFSVERLGNNVTLDGYLEVDVREFGLKPVKLLALSVEPVVKTHLHMIATRSNA